MSHTDKSAEALKEILMENLISDPFKRVKHEVDGEICRVLVDGVVVK